MGGEGRRWWKKILLLSSSCFNEHCHWCFATAKSWKALMDPHVAVQHSAAQSEKRPPHHTKPFFFFLDFICIFTFSAFCLFHNFVLRPQHPIAFLSWRKLNVEIKMNHTSISKPYLPTLVWNKRNWKKQYLWILQGCSRYEVVVIGALVGNLLQVLREMHDLPVHARLQVLKVQRETVWERNRTCKLNLRKENIWAPVGWTLFFYSAECQDRSCALCWTDRTCRGTAVWVQGRQRPPQSHPAALMSTRWPACILPLHRSQYFLDTRCHSHNYSPRGLLWCNGWSWTLRTLQRQHRPCSLFPHSLRDFRVTFSVKFGGEKKKNPVTFHK